MSRARLLRYLRRLLRNLRRYHAYFTEQLFLALLSLSFSKSLADALRQQEQNRQMELQRGTDEVLEILKLPNGSTDEQIQKQLLARLPPGAIYVGKVTSTGAGGAFGPSGTGATEEQITASLVVNSCRSSGMPTSAQSPMLRSPQVHEA